MSLNPIFLKPEEEALEDLKIEAGFSVGSSEIEGFGIEEKSLYEGMVEDYRKQRAEYVEQGRIPETVS